MLVYVQKTGLTGISLWDDLQYLTKTTSPVCLDVGANKGQTIDMLMKVFPSPIIHAFEPAENLVEILRQKYQKNSIKIYQEALGEKVENRRLSQYSDSRFNSLLSFTSSMPRHQHIVRSGDRPIVVNTVDAFVDSVLKSQVNILKIDTQGFDLAVLMGAANSFRQHMITTVSIELNFVELYEKQADPFAIFEFMRANNMALVSLYEHFFDSDRLAWCTALFHAQRPFA